MYQEPCFIHVAPAAPVFRPYTYSVDADIWGPITPGQRVLVPFGRRKLTAYVLRTHVDAADIKVPIKSIDSVLDAKPFFPPDMLPLYEWIAGYYKYPLGLTLEAALPQGINVTENTVYAPAAATDMSELGPGETQIMALLAKKPGTLKGLQRASGLPLKDVRREVNRLMALNLIKAEQVLQSQTARAKTEKWVLLNPAANCPPARMTAARLRTLELLRHTPAISLPALAAQADVSYAVIQKLAEQGLVLLEERRIYRDPLGFEINRDEPLTLNMAQAFALKSILHSMERPETAKPFLLQGITGSGKTELYLQATKAALDKERTALVLVPEIALITQTEHRFKARFGEAVAILHSALSAGERYDQWCRILNGEVKIVVGVRSAVFAPLQNLGLIVVDEEHDASYKQESGLKYHARDVAIVRARQAGCPIILGSATPSLQTAYNARQKKFTHLTLPERINEQQPVPVEVVDLRQALPNQKMLSGRLQKAIAETMQRGEQTLLFLNRRGFTPSLLCKDCGETLTCRHCDISLTYHKNKNAAICHFCGYSQPAEAPCEKCGSARLVPLGFGIQRVEEQIQALFPQARVARLDRDTATDRKTMLNIFRSLQQGAIDILLGTQMVAKGHDFPNITLVGIICADMSLNLPDFRADETTFQLLTQVAGRSGRGQKAGRVILQTYNPNHTVIKASCAQDFNAFFNYESETRKTLHYPPFSRMAQIRVNAKTAKATRATAEALGEFCQKRRLSHPGYRSIEVLGPVEAPIARINNWHRWHLILKSANATSLHAFVEDLLQTIVKNLENDEIRISVDVDPVSMM